MNSQIVPRRNVFRKALTTLLVSVAAGSASLAMANTMTQSLSFRLYPDATSQVLSFDPFDLSLGTLESVGITFDATRRHEIAIWNALDQAAAVSYEASLTGTSLLLDGVGFGFGNLAYGPASTGSLDSVSIPDFVAELQAGRTQFNAGLDPVYPSAFNPASTLTNLTGLYSPLSFISNLNLAYDPGIFSYSGPNSFASSLADVAGTATLTYTYKVVSVPEMLPGLMVPTLLIGLMMVAGTRRMMGRAAV